MFAMFRMCSAFQRRQVAGRTDWKVGYLNPVAISQSALNPKINPKSKEYVDKTPEEVADIQAELVLKQRSEAATYIYNCFMLWQDRHYSVAPYNGK